MSVDAIVSRILEDAGNRARSIVAAAEKERDEALEEFRKRLGREYRKESAKVKAAGKESLERGKFHVHREALKKLLSERRTMVDQAVEKAVRRLADARDEEYLELVSALLHRCDLEGEVEVLISPADESRITQRFLDEHSGDRRRFILSGERHHMPGGVIFRSGNISQNGTFSMIAELFHEDMVMELSGLVPVEKF